MLKKIVTVYFAILLTVTFFNVSLPTLPELLPEPSDVTLRDEPAPAAPGVTTVSMGDKSVYLGEPLDDVLACFGEAADVLPSEYGFLWYIFHNSYKDYIQIGFTNDRVVAMYTNAPDFLLLGLKPGFSRDAARLLLGDLTFEIEKKSARYQMMKADMPASEGDLFFTGDAYVHVFYDIFKNDSVTSVNIIAKETEEGFDERYGTPSR
ncbi:MAG: CAP-associated domain-containing protein, partial [Clostridia bacterium]